MQYHEMYVAWMEPRLEVPRFSVKGGNMKICPIVIQQGSQTQFTRVPLEAVFGCGRAAIGIPQKSSESILKYPY